MSGHVRLKPNGLLDEEIPTLLEIVLKYLSNNLNIIYNPIDQYFELKDEIVIPKEICERFLKYHQDCNEDVSDIFVSIFRYTNRTPLKHVALRNCTISDVGLEMLLWHNLQSLSVWYCERVTHNCWPKILEHSSNLESLELGRNVDILRHGQPNQRQALHFELNLPKLKKLRCNSVVLTHTIKFSHLKNLSHLDLTACFFDEFSIAELVDLPNLTTLILFCIWPLVDEIPNLCKLKTLIKLDISTPFSASGNGNYDNPNETLAEIVESLPLLTHLDISGTNLAGTGVAQFKASDKIKSSDIPGLVSRTDNPLQFLGLYNTAYSACRRFDIPAIKVSGEANEEQILTSALVYQDRPIMLTKVLNDLYHLLRYESCTSIHKVLDVVLSSMDRHLRIKHMQISGSATLFYIVKGRDKNKFGTQLKNHIIRTLLNGMSAHLTDDTMMRNGCLTLCQFSIPTDVLFEYERLVKILLHGVSDSEQEGFVQRIAIYLLNSLACQVDGRQKLFLGDMGVIYTMLNLIDDRLSRKVFDDVMEVAWSTMWNVTDETPRNCERFLDGQGMKYFLGCLIHFQEKEELVRNMMGLLGNVAEVKRLRHRLMSNELVTVFVTLLSSDSDGIEVSYNAAGVLAHIASDGPDVWNIKQPSREEVLKRLVMAIKRWNLNAERNINYRSFEPILGLVRCYETPECQHWAVWALANLTTVYRQKYTQLVEDEHGLELLQELIEHPRPYTEIKELAQKVVDNCRPPLVTEESTENNDITQMILDG